MRGEGAGDSTESSVRCFFRLFREVLPDLGESTNCGDVITEDPISERRFKYELIATSRDLYAALSEVSNVDG